MGKQTYIFNDHSLQLFKEDVDRLYEKHKFLTFKYVTGQTRTLKQQGAIHVYFRQAAAVLNDHGLYQTIDSKFLNEPLEVPWTEDSFKQFWKTIQKAMFDIDSTENLKTHQVSEVYDVINQLLSTRVGVHIPFPSKEFI
tara:strand:+ start:672 stop:1088 length:417 start_codon:yes stop_codon:yes gene_type:complete